MSAPARAFPVRRESNAGSSLAPGSAVLRELLVNQHFDGTLMLIALANATADLVLGSILFRKALNNAKRRGLVGKY